MPGLFTLLEFLIQGILLFLLISIWQMARWIKLFYGKVTMESVLYNVMFSFDGQSGADRGSIAYVRKHCLIRPLFYAAAGALALRVLDFALQRSATSIDPFVSYLLLACLTAQILYILVVKLSLFKTIWHAMLRQNSVVDELYVNPRDVTITPGRKKNLILIYVESLEAEYRNSDLFGRNLLQEIDDLGGESFERFVQLPGISATTLSAVATQCGIPFVPTLAASRSYNWRLLSGKTSKARFLPNALAVGDVLKAHGYTNAHLIGSSSKFHGLGQLFRDHGYRSLGCEELTPAFRSPPAISGWGLFDDDFLDISFKLLGEIAKRGNPFSLMLHTSDLHGPKGNFSPRQRARYGDGEDYCDLIAYTSSIVAAFVKRAEKQGYLKDTCVAIVGDHLSGRTPVVERIEGVPERGIYNRFLAPDGVQLARKLITHFDLFPTILEFMGFHIEGVKLGLGVSAIGPAEGENDPRSTGHIWTDAMSRTLSDRSAILNGLWRAPTAD